MHFLSRMEAWSLLGGLGRLTYWARNFELEKELSFRRGGKWIINEWDPYNGRYCALRYHVDPPHPPLWHEREPYIHGVGIPWRVYGGEMVDHPERSDTPQALIRDMELRYGTTTKKMMWSRPSLTPPLLAWFALWRLVHGD